MSRGRDPILFSDKGDLGNSNAATVMVLIMLPAFLFAMYEKDGMHLEDVLLHIIRVQVAASAGQKI